MHVANLPIGDEAPNVVHTVIEIPAGSKNKYEYDEKLQVIKLDRVSSSAMAHPFDYGFIPETRCDDGDHLDIFVINKYSLFPGCVVAVRPVGLMRMIDDGAADEKIIGVPAKDPRYAHIQDLGDLTPHLPKEIQHFFEHYKDLEGKKTEVTGWEGAEAARAMIQQAQAAYQR